MIYPQSHYHDCPQPELKVVLLLEVREVWGMEGEGEDRNGWTHQVVVDREGELAARVQLVVGWGVPIQLEV
jgi:hypothetical protein